MSFEKVFLAPPAIAAEQKHLNSQFDDAMEQVLKLKIPDAKKMALYYDVLNKYKRKKNGLLQPPDMTAPEVNEPFSPTQMAVLKNLLKENTRFDSPQSSLFARRRIQSSSPPRVKSRRKNIKIENVKDWEPIADAGPKRKKKKRGRSTQRFEG